MGKKKGRDKLRGMDAKHRGRREERWEMEKKGVGKVEENGEAIVTAASSFEDEFLR